MANPWKIPTAKFCCFWFNSYGKNVAWWNRCNSECSLSHEVNSTLHWFVRKMWKYDLLSISSWILCCWCWICLGITRCIVVVGLRHRSWCRRWRRSCSCRWWTVLILIATPSSCRRVLSWWNTCLILPSPLRQRACPLWKGATSRAVWAVIVHMIHLWGCCSHLFYIVFSVF